MVGAARRGVFAAAAAADDDENEDDAEDREHGRAVRDDPRLLRPPEGAPATSGDERVAGDEDGAACVKSTTGAAWTLSNSNTTPAADITLSFGIASDFPLAWR